MAADSPRIPAWKKLGLKLKNAREDIPTENDTSGSNGPVIDVQSTPTKKTEKRPPQVEDSAPPAKKQRLESPRLSDNKTEADAQAETNGTKKDVNGQKAPKKSVAFAADTKSTDGPREPEQEPDDDIEPSSTGKKKAAKKEKKSKKQKQAQNGSTNPTQASGPGPSSATSSTPSDPLLEYLSVYHKSRPQWKFQKNRETQLFKHILSLERIPASYNAALASYLAGLKGEGAKKRLATVAREAIEADQAEIAGRDDDSKARDDYNNAISSFRGQLIRRKKDQSQWEENDDNDNEHSNLDESWSKLLNKKKRAELVLAYVDDVARDRQHQPVQKKKRKTRTAIIDDESSSDSSSSSSESESESDSSSSSDDESSSGSDSESDSDSVTSSSSDSSSDTDSGSDSDSESD